MPGPSRTFSDRRFLRMGWGTAAFLACFVIWGACGVGEAAAGSAWDALFFGLESGAFCLLGLWSWSEDRAELE